MIDICLSKVLHSISWLDDVDASEIWNNGISI